MVSHSFGRGMRTVGSPKRIINKYTCILGKLGGKRRLIFLLFLVEASILKHQNITILEFRYSCVNLGTDTVLNHADWFTNQFSQALSHGCHAHLLIDSAFRTPTVGSEHDPSTCIAQELDSR